MVCSMARRTQPAHQQRLSVVVVMHLALWFAAPVARLTHDLAAPQGHFCLGAGNGLRALSLGHAGIRPAVRRRIGIAAWPAPTAARATSSSRLRSGVDIAARANARRRRSAADPNLHSAPPALPADSRSGSRYHFLRGWLLRLAALAHELPWRWRIHPGPIFASSAWINAIFNRNSCSTWSRLSLLSGSSQPFASSTVTSRLAQMTTKSAL